MIEIRNLHKSFGGLEVLKGIDLEIKKGEIVTIVGPSGSGKSTVLRCMNLLEVPTTGQIIFEGTDITDKKVNIDEVRQRIGIRQKRFLSITIIRWAKTKNRNSKSISNGTRYDVI